jgi:hypothetical protein
VNLKYQKFRQVIKIQKLIVNINKKQPIKDKIKNMPNAKIYNLYAHHLIIKKYKINSFIKVIIMLINIPEIIPKAIIGINLIVLIAIKLGKKLIITHISIFKNYLSKL